MVMLKHVPNCQRGIASSGPAACRKSSNPFFSFTERRLLEGKDGVRRFSASGDQMSLNIAYHNPRFSQMLLETLQNAPRGLSDVNSMLLGLFQVTSERKWSTECQKLSMQNRILGPSRLPRIIEPLVFPFHSQIQCSLACL